MMETIKSVLVTGGAGFIGSHTIFELLSAGYDVITIDNFENAVCDSEGNATSVQRVEQMTGKKVIFRNVDVRNRHQLVSLFMEHKIDGVIHLAGYKSVPDSCKKPLEYYRNNLIGSVNIMQVCNEMGVKNFIFSSSCTVYGKPKELPITENHNTGLNLTNPYARTKYMVEEILFSMSISDPQWNIIILRYFNPVGAHQSGRIGEDPKGICTTLMPNVCKVAVNNMPYLNIYGTDFDTPDGSCVRDFIHIVDLAKGHIAALQLMSKKNVGCQSYNLGMGQGYSVLDIVQVFEKISGCTIKKKFRGRRIGDIASTYCNPTLAALELDWKTEFDLKKICQDLWKWQSLNPNGYHDTECRINRKA